MYSNPRPGTLTQEGKSETGIRNNVCTGHFYQLPTPGRGFQFTGKAIDPGADMRFIHTSRVAKILATKPGKVTFRTENTTYHLEYTAS